MNLVAAVAEYAQHGSRAADLFLKACLCMTGLLLQSYGCYNHTACTCGKEKENDRSGSEFNKTHIKNKKSILPHLFTGGIKFPKCLNSFPDPGAGIGTFNNAHTERVRKFDYTYC